MLLSRLSDVACSSNVRVLSVALPRLSAAATLTACVPGASRNMSSTCPCVAAAPSKSALTVAASTPEPASVTVNSIAEKSSESNSTPSGAGLVIVISGGVVSRKTERVTGAPAGSASDGSNVWHGSAVRSCTW